MRTAVNTTFRVNNKELAVLKNKNQTQRKEQLKSRDLKSLILGLVFENFKVFRSLVKLSKLLLACALH